MTEKTVLIVEDQGITAMCEAQIMHDLDYQVTGISISGEDAITQAARSMPDVVLMDIKLAGEMMVVKPPQKFMKRTKYLWFM